MYVIVDENNGMLRIGNVPLYGNKVELFACFKKEDDALKTLYQVELSGIKGHRVEYIGETFFVEPETAETNRSLP